MCRKDRRRLLFALSVCLVWAGSLHAQTPKPKPVAVKFDEFKYDFKEDMKARLAPLAGALKQQPRARAFIIGYAARMFRYGDSSASDIAAYVRLDLTNRHEDTIDWDRIVLIDGGYREEQMVELYLVPPGAAPPAPRPTLQPAQVTFCPHIMVNPPFFVWDVKGTLKFSATVREELTKIVPTYLWTVSHGRISSGQGTAEIAVQQSAEEYQPVTATVEIGGYAPGCGSSVSASATSPEKLSHVPLKFGEMGNVAAGDMKAHLDNYAVGLAAAPEMQAYIIFYGGRRDNGRLPRRGEAERLAARLPNYLVKTRAIAPARITLINGGFREEWTAELWLSPRGAKAPAPAPTIAASEIKFRPERRRRRR
ncbi:MAG TPA: hypothetical protein VGB76_02795 [Pyrinomonadaceae bacterium]|jgi:hypothetical protein